MSSSLRAKYASIMLLLSAAAASAAPTTVAFSGTAAPGGGTYGVFTNPILNASGQVAFNASVIGGTSTSGIFTGTPGSVSAAALQGTAAPSGGNYGALYAAATTISDVLNSSGELAFTAPLTGGTSTSGIFTDTAGTYTTVALKGNAAPSGGNYNAFLSAGTNQAYSPVLNDSGQLGIQATLTGGAAAAGIFVGASAATLQTVALVGGAAPMPPGSTYATTVTVPTLNPSGQVAFVSIVNSLQGIFAGAPGSIQTVMYQGNAAPGAGGALYGTPTTTYSFNNAGQVGFITSLTGGTSTSGVFAGAAGSVQAVALNNTLAPGGTGGNYTTFSNVTISATGLTTFTGNLTGGTAGSGVFQGTSAASVQPVALAGGTTPDGAMYASIASGVVQNDLGQVAFVANLTGTGVTTGTNSVELDAGTPGALVELVRQGDVINVAPVGSPVDLETVSGFGLLGGTGDQDGKGMDLNDSGEVAYRLTFTDGTSGVFESTIPSAVPEPASLSVLVVGAGMLLRRNRKGPVKLH